MRYIIWPLVLALLALAALASYRVIENRVEAEVYRARLEALNEDFLDLRSQYNEAVRRTAVTELVVANGGLTVVIRTAQGELKAIPTAFDPTREIYVDYVVIDGRLWIRRVFDDATAPQAGLLIDPNLATVAWDAPTAHHGKAAYRQLDEGRWVVSVTGNGTLGLARRSEKDISPLVSAPVIRDYPPAAEEVRDQLSQIRAGELARAAARELGAVFE